MVRARRVIRDLGGIGRLQLLHADLPRDLRPVRLGRTARPCRRSSSSCPTGSRSTSTRCRPGRAAIVVPLSVIWAYEARSAPCPGARVDLAELRTPASPAEASGAQPARSGSGAIFFGAVDRVPRRPSRLAAGRRCAGAPSQGSRRGSSSASSKSDGLGAIFPPIINTIIAFRCLGYAPDDPRLVEQVEELEKLEIEDDETLRVQPCFSPVWDTAIAVVGAAGVGAPPDDPRAPARGALARRPRGPGARRLAAARLRRRRAGGWYFEYANEFYPDTDDTAEVLTSLSRACAFPTERRGPAARGRDRARAGLAARRCRTGTAAGAPSTGVATTRS